MADQDITAIAAHLHVLLRRKAGRVTDIEWMVVNMEYASAVATFAKAKAVELQAQDLEMWAIRLEAAILKRRPVHKPLVQTVTETVRGNQQSAGTSLPPESVRQSGFRNSILASGFGDSVPASTRPPGMPDKDGTNPDPDDGPRYVGGLR